MVERNIQNEDRLLLMLVSDAEIAIGEELGKTYATKKCSNSRELINEIERGVGCLVISIEVLDQPDADRLFSILGSQPEWSDLPVILIGDEQQFVGHSEQIIQQLGNLAFLARPVNSTELRMAISRSLRDRQRQNHIRSLLSQRDHAVTELQKRVDGLEEIESALTDSEGRAQALIEASSQMVWSTDANGQVVEPSETWSEFTGQTFEEFRGAGWLNALHPDDRDRTLRGWKKAVELLEPYDVEYRVRHVSGEWQWTAARGVPQFSPDGTVRRWVGMNSVIERHKKLENSLRASQTRLDMSLRAANVAAWEWAPNYSIWEDGVYELLGIPVDLEASTELFFKSVHPDDLPTLKKSWEKAVAGESRYYDEFRIIRPDGEVRWLVGTGELIRNDRDEVDHIYGLNWDITVQRENQERLTVSEAEAQQFRQLVESSTDFIGIATPDGQGVYLNSGGKRLVGLPEDVNVSSTNIIDYIHPDDVKKMTDVAIPAMKSHGHWRGEVKFRHFVTGVPIPTIWNSFTIQGDSDTPDVWATISPDLTHLKEMESALRESEQQALKANRAKSEFLANMSHEIRTPMTAILGFADLLLSSETRSDQRNLLQTIRRNGEFLVELINDILDLSKIEAGKMEIEACDFSLAQLISDVVSLMQGRADQKGISLTVEYRTEIPRVIRSDAKSLKQILVNLLGNAVKFTHSGFVKLAVSFHPGEGTSELILQVKDTGIGISLENQRRLFDPFVQLDSSTTREFEGTGLGLAISQRLADMLDGRIEVSSKLNEGSQFDCTFSIPSIEPVELWNPTQFPDHDRQSELSKAAESPDPQLPFPCRILVVDDQRDIRILTKRYLEKMGVDVTFAANGIEALENIQKAFQGGTLPDVILLDMQMPKMDGYQTIVELRKLGFDKPVIALTADAMHGDMDRCLQSGCNAYLSKPIDVAELVSTLNAFLSPSR